MPLPLDLPLPASFDDTALQMERLKEITNFLRNDERCQGAALVGSFAKGTADRMSDLDLIVYARDEEVGEIADGLRGLIPDEDVLWSFSGHYDDFSVFTKCILLNFTSVEFSVIGTSTTSRFKLRRPYIELANRNSFLSSRVSDLPTIDKAEFPVYVNGERGLMWELFSYLKRLRRGQVESVKKDLLRLAGEISRTLD
ncbi:nucleotidyltransferase domain-containing protein [Cupriavidus sp. NPDC089707]|uniref:nucleotidyltransferase domain-containing protein n=1 Tax=Cupriavidus sp. NPDC089707 TaxID=3363963 RepID=UPI00381DE737